MSPLGTTLLADNDLVNIAAGLSASFELLPDQRYLQPSDARLKRDVARVGRLANGLPLYRYRYLWSDTEFVGVMAQEVALLVPEAVLRGDDGYLRVDYARLGTRLMTLAEWYTAPAAYIVMAGRSAGHPRIS